MCVTQSFHSILAVALVERPSSADLGVQLVDSERSGRKTQSDLVELATQIQTADAFTRSNVCNKLQVIADQVRFLHEQARRILEETKEAENLHHFAWYDLKFNITCTILLTFFYFKQSNFKKVPGKVYYLYQRPSGQKYFAMLSPEVCFSLTTNASYFPNRNFLIMLGMGCKLPSHIFRRLQTRG
jgi:hypothetical protein